MKGYESEMYYTYTLFKNKERMQFSSQEKTRNGHRAILWHIMIELNELIDSRSSIIKTYVLLFSSHCSQQNSRLVEQQLRIMTCEL